MKIKMKRKIKKTILIFFLVLAILILMTLYTGNTYIYYKANGITMEDIKNPFFLLPYYKEYSTNFLINKAFRLMLGTFLILIGITGGIILKRQKDNSYGTARWANLDDLDLLGVLKNKYTDGVILGLAKGLFKEYKVIDNSNTHIALIAPTRAGKGVGVIIPTLLNWQSSSIVLDLKKENYVKTAGFREKILKHKIIKFAPHDENSSSYNPLAQIRLRTKYEYVDAQIIADILTDPGEGKARDHWVTQASALLVALILHVCYEKTKKGEVASLGHVMDFFNDPSKPILERILELMKFNHSDDPEFFNTIYDSSQNAGINPGTHPIVSRTAAEIINKDPRESSGIISSCITAITLYKDPIIRKNTTAVDFKINDLMNDKTPVDLYVIIEAVSISVLSPLIRILISQIIGILCPKMEDPDKMPHKHKLLLMLDEFPAFGKIPLLEKALAYIAGYGMKAVVIAQGINQLRQAYGDKNMILENCSTAVFYTPQATDKATAELISALLGKRTLKTQNKSFKALKLDTGNISENKIARELLTPEEVMRYSDKKNLIFFKGKPTYRGIKVTYFNNPYFKDKAKIKPSK
ncbi:Conjugal transfer protein traG [Fusobacterium necrogenes]|uniref:Conjugal transfer protein traG n=1 Tax=Fusobacterium necrogenes TaxID=858 RepID=A0A377GPQ1_9FUSO|nr:type IV secretory system conjugative DNA transfer family protein [Fusobacterium necrogenes]STO26887.1 Conjugal transfer protein traG [Fusobacterium necrogenes]